MTIDQLREAVRTEPFRPFVVRMTDGREYHVRHPEILWLPPNKHRTAVVALPRGEAVAVLDVFHIAAVVKDDGDGQPRKKAG